MHSITHKKCCLAPERPLGAVIVERLVKWKRREFSSLDIDQTLRMWVKTLNPSWSDPSPYHDLRALKVPTLRASLGITGPPLAGFPLPCPFGNCGMDTQGWHNAKCTFVCCIPDGHSHRMNAPCKRSTRHWGVLVTRGGLVDPVDCTESGCNELHSIPPNILDLEERCNLKMCILASQRHAQNTEG